MKFNSLAITMRSGEKFYFLATRTAFADHHKWRCGATNVSR
jgi:hypothetical protein